MKGIFIGFGILMLCLLLLIFIGPSPNVEIPDSLTLHNTLADIHLRSGDSIGVQQDRTIPYGGAVIGADAQMGVLPVRQVDEQGRPVYPFSIGLSSIMPRRFSSAQAHSGIDITVPKVGEKRLAEILSVREGVVIAASDKCVKTSNGECGCGCHGEGNKVVIVHEDGTVTRYVHLQPSTVAVVKGDKVSAGHVLGRMGNSGSSFGVHLHFSMYGSRLMDELTDFDVTYQQALNGDATALNKLVSQYGKKASDYRGSGETRTLNSDVSYANMWMSTKVLYEVVWLLKIEPIYTGDNWMMSIWNWAKSNYTGDFSIPGINESAHTLDPEVPYSGGTSVTEYRG